MCLGTSNYLKEERKLLYFPVFFLCCSKGRLWYSGLITQAIKSSSADQVVQVMFWNHRLMAQMRGHASNGSNGVSYNFESDFFKQKNPIKPKLRECFDQFFIRCYHDSVIGFCNIMASTMTITTVWKIVTKHFNYFLFQYILRMGISSFSNSDL